MQVIDKFLIKSLGLKSEETKLFKLMFFHSFFVGLFIAFYFVQANSVFIQEWGSEHLPAAYIAAGIVGYLISSLYSILQKKIKSKYLFISALLFMFTVALVSRVAFGMISDKYLSFFVFIWAWPFISIVGIESGGLALKLLNLIQVKRLFGLINMGGVIASILGYLIIPLISGKIGTSYNLLYFGLVSVLLAVLMIILIYKDNPEKKNDNSKRNEKQDKTGFKHLLKEKYFRLIFISTAFSMTVIYLADFGFLSSIKAQKDLFADGSKIAGFIALVYAGLKVGELLISYFSSRILSKYGVKLGLIIMPATLTFIIAVSAFVGLTAGVATVFFLILMTLNKSMERILRRGLDDPAFNILYQPLPSSMQLVVQSKVGIVMQLGIGFAGALLFGMSTILKTGGGYKLEYFTLLFLPILVAWLLVAWNLYATYKNKLRELLRELSKQQTREQAKYLYGTEVLTKKFKKLEDNVVNLSVTILSETNPRILEPFATALLAKDDIVIKRALLRNIDPTWRTRLSKKIESIEQEQVDSEIKHLAQNAIKYLDFKNVELTPEELVKYSASSDPTKQMQAVKHLIQSKNSDAETAVLNLLDSKNKIVKMSAMRLVIQIRTEKTISKLVANLKSPKYYHIAAAAVLDIGETTLSYLEELYSDTTEIEVLLKIIEIYAKMGSRPARSLLLAQINYPIRKIQLAAIWALYFCKYQADDQKEIEIVERKIESVIANLLWIMSAIRDIEDEKATLKLFLALDQEKTDNFENLFNLLSFLHDPRVINLIKNNIVGKNTIYALELIDNFIIPELKPLIVPIFDDISIANKIKKLSKKFPQKKMTFQERLQDIIMLDYDKLDVWTVTKAIEMMGRVHKKKQEKQLESESKRSYEDVKLWTKENIFHILRQIRRSELPDEVFLCLFHTDELVFSTAARVIYDESPVKCIEYLENMSEEKQNLKDIFVSGGDLLPDRVKLLRRFQLFFSIPDNLLVKLAKLVRSIDLKKGDKIFFETKDSENIIIILNGQLVSDDGGEHEVSFGRKLIVTRGLNIDQEIEFLTAKKTSQVLVIDRYKYFNLLVDETEILQHIFEVIQDE